MNACSSGNKLIIEKTLIKYLKRQFSRRRHEQFKVNNSMFHVA